MEGVHAAAFAHAGGMEVDGALEADRAAVREIFKEWHDEFLQDLVSTDVRGAHGGGGGAAQAKSNCVRIKNAVNRAVNKSRDGNCALIDDIVTDLSILVTIP